MEAWLLAPPTWRAESPGLIGTACKVLGTSWPPSACTVGCSRLFALMGRATNPEAAALTGVRPGVFSTIGCPGATPVGDCGTLPWVIAGVGGGAVEIATAASGTERPWP